jgi:xanthine dehydrogenase YagS FAD-binding subunit
VAAAIDIDAGQIRSVRLAAGGVGTKPWRFREAETLLVGGGSNQDAWERAAGQCIADATPAPQNGFKVELLRRAVIRALARVGGAA